MNDYLHQFSSTFAEVNETIIQSYEVDKINNGIKSFRLTKEAQDSVNNKFHGGFYSKWKDFTQLQINKSTYELGSSTSVVEPSYTLYCVIDNLKVSYIESSLKLVLSVSLLGPYYLIYGLEEVRIQRQSKSTPYPESFFGNVQKIVSPIGIISPLYVQLKGDIKKQFPKYRQIPFFILESQVNGIRLNESPTECTVFDALFAGLDQSHFKFVGDPYYALDEWKK